MFGVMKLNLFSLSFNVPVPHMKKMNVVKCLFSFSAFLFRVSVSLSTFILYFREYGIKYKKTHKIFR